jgi:glycosyltransferase involved in cell wall biosynthesis
MPIRGGKTMKAAYFGSPTPYGLFSLYRNLRAELEPQGIQLRWIGNGEYGAKTYNNPIWESERKHGEVVGSDLTNIEDIGKAIVRHLSEQRYDAIFINAPQEFIEMNVARYLPSSILRVLLIGMMGSGTYRLCRGIRDYVHATVALCPRTQNDLVKGFGFDPDRISIAGEIDLAPYRNLPLRPASDHLRAIYFGRISDSQKGIFNLPRIFKQLGDVPARLSIVGDGPDLEKLKRLCQPMSDRISFTPPVPPQDIPKILSQHDVFIFTTRCEGLGYVLLEALAAGCVPVCSRIRGVTDYVVRDGETGILFPVDDVATAAAGIRRLAQNPQILHSMRVAGMEDCRLRFDTAIMGPKWGQLLHTLRDHPPEIANPLPLEQWSYPPDFRRTWRAWIPERLKNLIRARIA